MSDSIVAQLSEVYSHCSTLDILTDVVHVLNTIHYKEVNPYVTIYGRKVVSCNMRKQTNDKHCNI